MSCRKRFLLVYATLGALGLASAPTAAQESLVYQPATGNYTLTYDCGEDGGMVTTTITPFNKIVPTVESSFTRANGDVAYRYAVALATTSRDALRLFAMDPIEQVWNIVEPPSDAMLKGASQEDLQKFKESALATAPQGWKAINSTNHNGSARVGWSRVELRPSAFAPGSRQAGFKFSSRHLPGVVIAKFLGDGATWGFPCESPGSDTQVGRDLEVLRRNNYVPRFAAAPVIRVRDPFDAIDVLTTLRNHVPQFEQWQLTDAVFASQIRGYLSEAITNLQAQNTAGGAAALGKLRAALRVKHPTLDSETVAHALPPSAISQNPVDDIRKLVTDYDRVLMARVLDFDAAYVIGRLGPVPTIP